jgi:hypothetical protein
MHRNIKNKKRIMGVIKLSFFNKSNTQIERLRSIDVGNVSFSPHLFGEKQHFLHRGYT